MESVRPAVNAGFTMDSRCRWAEVSSFAFIVAGGAFLPPTDHTKQHLGNRPPDGIAFSVTEAFLVQRSGCEVPRGGMSNWLAPKFADSSPAVALHRPFTPFPTSLQVEAEIHLFQGSNPSAVPQLEVLLPVGLNK